MFAAAAALGKVVGIPGAENSAAGGREVVAKADITKKGVS
jgi:hypothetical protein